MCIRDRFYAAVATIAILVTEVFWALRSGFEHPAFMQAGLLSIGFFATAISARLLAKRVLANEELAKQRGIALANQTLVSQRVIEEMQDGVLLVSQEARVLQHNPRAERMLGLRAVADGPLATYSTELAESFAAWQSGGAAEPEPFQIAASGLTLRARFVVTESSDRAVLVFLEDMGRVQERAQQLKLAALGRLTANIAHEIRNPLNAALLQLHLRLHRAERQGPCHGAERDACGAGADDAEVAFQRRSGRQPADGQEIRQQRQDE